MRSVFYPHLVDGPAGDPALYVRLAHRREALLFDCGALSSLPPRAMSKVGTLFISHAHVDHFIDFDRLVRFFLYSDHHLHVIGPSGLCDKVAGRLAGYTWNLVDGYPFRITVREWDGRQLHGVRFGANDAFRPEPLPAVACRDGVLLTTPSYRVSAVSLDHGDIVSLAFALEEMLHVAIHKDALDAHGYATGPWLTTFKDKVRSGQDTDEVIAVPLLGGGRVDLPIGELRSRIAHTEPGMKVCYVTDVAPTDDNLERIASLASGAHLLAIEAPFSHDDIERARQRNHLTARLAGSVARRARVARCLFFHFSPRYQDRQVDLLAEAEQAFRGAETDP